MGANWSNPTVNSNYVDFPGEIKDRDDDVATMFADGAATNIPTNSIRYVRATNKFQEWNGAVWSDLVLAIAGGGTGAASASAARTALGLGSMATQDNNAVSITGGSIARAALPSTVGYLDEAEVVTAAWRFQVGTAINNGTPSDLGIVIPSGTPAVVTNNLYSVGGALYFNGAILATGSAVSGTTGKLSKFTSATALGDSIASESGTVLTVANTVNAVSGFQLNGAAQQNVASGQSPAFVGTNFTGVPAAGISAGTFSGAFTFGALTVTTLNTYTFDQSVASGASPTFTTVTGAITGNAGSATVLQTARTIAGVSFNGSANIAIASTGLSDTANIVYSATAPTLTGTNFTGIPETAITDGSILARLAANEDITGSWGFSSGISKTGGSSTNSLYFLKSAGDGANYAALSLNFTGNAAAASRVFGIQTIEQGVANAGILRLQPYGGTTEITSTLTWGGGSAISSSSNVALLNAANTFTNTGNTIFSGNVRLNQSTSDWIEVANSSNTQKAIYVGSNAAGTLATADLRVQSVAYTGYVSLPTSTFTTVGLREANVLYIGGDMPTVRLGTSHASGVTQIYSYNALAATFGASQGATFTGTIYGVAYTGSTTNTGVWAGLATRNLSNGTAAVNRLALGNDNSAVAFTIDVRSSTYTGDNYGVHILNQHNAPLYLGGYGGPALTLGLASLATFAGAVTIPGTLTLSGTAANISLGSNYISTAGGDNGISISGGGVVVITAITPDATALSVSDWVYTPGLDTGTGTDLVLTSGNYIVALTSSESTKKNITRKWRPAQGLNGLYETQPIKFDYLQTPGMDAEGNSIMVEGPQDVIGFSAEELAALGLPGLVNLDSEGNPYSIRTQGLIAYQHMLILDLNERLAKAEGLLHVH